MGDRWKFDLLLPEMNERYEKVTSKKYAAAIKSGCYLTINEWKVTELVGVIRNFGVFGLPTYLLTQLLTYLHIG